MGLSVLPIDTLLWTSVAGDILIVGGLCSIPEPTKKQRITFSQMRLSLLFGQIWDHEALETFGLPPITLAGKAKTLMATPGSDIWSLFVLCLLF